MGKKGSRGHSQTERSHRTMALNIAPNHNLHHLPLKFIASEEIWNPLVFHL